MRYLLFLVAIVAGLTGGCGRKTGSEYVQEEKSGIADTTSIDQYTAVADTIAANDTIAGTISLTKAEFLQKIWNYNDSPKEWKFLGNRPAIIDFYADWCSPCRIASPILEKVAVQYAGRLNVYQINTEKEHELATVFRIQNIPAFLYIPVTGKPVMAAGIGRTEEETMQLFIGNISKYLLIQEE